MVSARKLIRVHQGVFAVGHAALTNRSYEMAAVLACGIDRSFISHVSAARIWKMIDYPDWFADVHVSLIDGDPKHSGVVVHCLTALDSSERKEVDGIPVTSPARTLLDLASREKTKAIFEKAINQGLIKRAVKKDAIAAIAEKYAGRPGSKVLSERIGEDGYSRSEAEDRMWSLIKKAGLPLPERNAPLLDMEVDFLWRKERFVLEVDGYKFHSTWENFERDHQRDGVLKNAKYEVLRVTWNQITKQPDTVVRWIRQCLQRATS